MYQCNNFLREKSFFHEINFFLRGKTGEGIPALALGTAYSRIVKRIPVMYIRVPRYSCQKVISDLVEGTEPTSVDLPRQCPV